MGITISPIGGYNNIGPGQLVTFSSTTAAAAGDYLLAQVLNPVTGDIFTEGEQFRQDPTDVLLGWSFAAHTFTGLYLPRKLAPSTANTLSLVIGYYTAASVLKDSAALAGLTWNPAGYPPSLVQSATSPDISAILAAVQRTYHR